MLFLLHLDLLCMFGNSCCNVARRDLACPVRLGVCFLMMEQSCLLVTKWDTEPLFTFHAEKISRTLVVCFEVSTYILISLLYHVFLNNFESFIALLRYVSIF